MLYHISLGYKNKTELNDEGHNSWSKKFNFVAKYLDVSYQLRPQIVIEKTL